jgi:hypothetical protein
VTARITGGTGLDLVLELFDQRGHLVVRAPGAPGGDEARLGPIAIGPGEAFIRARPLWIDGDPRSDERTGPYVLTVDWSAPRPDWELEPNDTPGTATSIDGTRAISGYLSSLEDEDWFRVPVPPASRLEGRVDGLDGVDLVLLIGDERARVDRLGVGEHESFWAAPARDGHVLVGIAQRPLAGARTAPPSDEPYTLKLRLRPAPAVSAPVASAKRS